MADSIRDIENEIVERGIEAEQKVDWGETPFLQLSAQDRAEIVLEAAIEGEFGPVEDHMIDPGDGPLSIENAYGFATDAERIVMGTHPGSHTRFGESFLLRVKVVAIEARESGDRQLVGLLRGE